MTRGWVLRSTDDDPVVVRVQTGGIKTIGRGARADFVLEAALVSRIHCRLTAEASQQLIVEDLESTNGTFVNGEKVDRAVLKTGDRLAVGRVEFVVGADDAG